MICSFWFFTYSLSINMYIILDSLNIRNSMKPDIACSVDPCNHLLLFVTDLISTYLDMVLGAYIVYFWSYWFFGVESHPLCRYGQISLTTCSTSCWSFYVCYLINCNYWVKWWFQQWRFPSQRSQQNARNHRIYCLKGIWKLLPYFLVLTAISFKFHVSFCVRSHLFVATFNCQWWKVTGQ